MVIVSRGGEQYAPVASWPESGTNPLLLSEVVEQVIDEQCGLLNELKESSTYAIAYPVMINGDLRGVAALEVAVAGEANLQRAMEQLQWGAAWLELLIRKKKE